MAPRRRPLKVLREVESSPGLQKWLPQIAQPADAPRDILYGEIFDAHAAINLFPGHRRRHRRLGTRSDGIHRSERAAPSILIVVDQHAAARTFRDAVLRRDECGMAV